MMVGIFKDLPARVLAIFAHPDDAETACGGTLATFAKNGSSVKLIYLAAGDKGSFDMSLEPRRVAEIRQFEANNAALHLGIDSVESYMIPDGEIFETEDLRFKIVKQIRSFRPNVVICPDPTAVFFPGNYYNHRDHRTTGLAVMDCISPEAAMPFYHREAGEPYQVPTVLLSGTLHPDTAVDVSDGIDQKIKAVLAYESRVKNDASYISEFLRKSAQRDGKLGDIAYAENFRRIVLNSSDY